MGIDLHIIKGKIRGADRPGPAPHAQSEPHADLGLFHDPGQFLFLSCNSLSLPQKWGHPQKKDGPGPPAGRYPTDPAAEMILPQFGSPPKKAVLTRFELAIGIGNPLCIAERFCLLDRDLDHLGRPFAVTDQPPGKLGQQGREQLPETAQSSGNPS